MTRFLPTGWISARLGDLISVRYGKGLPERSRDNSHDIPVFGSAGIVGRHRTALVEGPILVVGRKGNVGSVFLTDGPSWPIDTTYFLNLPQGIDGRFLYYQLQASDITAKDSSTAVPSLRRQDLEDLNIVLAPSAEQRRIVAAIEEQFSRIDAGVEVLQRARRNLQRMRAAVLRSAIQGRLVPSIMGDGAEVALKRLASVRGDSRDERKKQKVPEAISLEAELPSLPVGWTWTTVYELRGTDGAPVLTGPFGTTLGREDFKGQGVPLLTIGCLTDRGVALDKALHVAEGKAASLARYRLEPGDLLFSRMATVGRVGVVTQREAGALINYHLMRLRLSQEVLLPEYLAIYIRGSPIVRTYVAAVNHGVTRPGINTAQLLAMPVALPPLEEQKSVTEEVERQFSLLDKLEVAVLATTQRSKQLRQAVLSQAFAGRLVGQDASDEPTSTLLDRVRAARDGRKPKGNSWLRRTPQ